MAVTELNRLHIKVGTKAQYNTNKGSLDPTNTLALTPLASEFTSNTSDAGQGKFSVSGNVITTLYGTKGTAQKPVYLNNGTLTQCAATSTTTRWDETTGSVVVTGTTGNTVAGHALWLYTQSTSSGGVPNYRGAIQLPANDAADKLTANRTYTLPNESGKIVLDTNFKDANDTSTTTALPIYFAADTTYGAITNGLKVNSNITITPSTRTLAMSATGIITIGGFTIKRSSTGILEIS